MSEHNEIVLATIRKNSREEIRVTRGEFRGHDLISVRVWFADRESGEMRPGRDGLAFRVGLLADVVAALEKATEGNAP